MEDTKESNSSGISPEGCSREPLLQLQSLQAQNKQVSISKVHGLKKLSWPPRQAAGGGLLTSIKQFPPHPLPPSHSRAPVIISAGRPIVILPNDYIHSHRDFPPVASLSLGHFHDPTPAPIITPVDDYATTPAPVITPVDDDSPSAEHTVPDRQFGGVKAIEFTDDKQCIVPVQPEADPHNKEESTLSTGKHTSQLISCDNASNSQELNTSPPATEFDVTSLCKVDLMPNNDESANSTTELPAHNPSSNSHLSLGMESGNEVQNLEQLQLPVQKSSSMRVSPLIMSCYEESKEQLVLDDSDSELEMPECSKSACCTPPEQSTSGSGIEDHVYDSSINIPPPKEGTIGADEPPSKRAKLMETSMTDSSDSLADNEYNCTPAASDEKQDDDPQSPIVQESSAESGENFGQVVPNKSPLLEPLEAAEPTETSSTLADTVPDHSLKLKCPHEPLDAQVSDGKDTVDQMLPMESAREHAMVPNLVRCADDDQLDNDRDEPDDDSSGSTHLKAYAPAQDLHPSCLGSLEGVQNRVDDTLVPGQMVVEQKIETGIQVPELHKEILSPYYPLKSADTATSAKPGADVCTPSLGVPPTMEPARLPTEHQIVPEEFAGNTTPSSSQSLYTDHDFHEKCKLSLQFQEESSIDDELNGPRVLAMSLDAIEKRLNIAPSLSHSDDQALPDLESPSQLIQPHYSDGGSPAEGSGSCGLDEQIGGSMASGQNLGPFGFRLGMHTPCHQSSGNSISTTRLNLGRPHLRLGLSKRQQCTPLHRPK